ncbi:GNAT family N-acetyltransferase [Paenibacillus sp. WQ 127069]|uniref:GNAT family N-acetyltransferase n=1 Tax=Paenibacillus baimaensis TaxID=2982185 RepID=A0ABT2UDG4_9BACL|nr:GNAT family N-acetyltransferase [Paenibacillus sp. WQ 127069]MCU6792692.1 GNAT family N-acetyltransferase [Paenibacillus sp. WQ 127069]
MDYPQSYWYEGLDIRKLGHDEVVKIHELMLDVVSRLPHKSLFVTDDEDYFHDLLEQHGEIYGAYDKGKLVAYSVLAYPGTGEKNLGREFGVPDEELSRVWALDSTIVHESVRGRGLHRYFNDLREKRAKILGGQYLYSTVHPDNEASLRNLEAAQLSFQFTRLMYGGFQRHCYAKQL